MNRDFVQTVRNVVVVLAVFSAIAIGVNLVILEVFHQKSSYRAAHSLIGVIMLMGFVYTFSGDRISLAKAISLFLVSLVPCYFGTVFPDLDISLLGIGGHRNPIFHSGILFFTLLFFFRKSESYLIAVLISALGVGMGSHLIWDMFDHADVRWIPGGSLDRIWLGVNGFLCILLARTTLSHRIPGGQ